MWGERGLEGGTSPLVRMMMPDVAAILRLV